MQQIRFLREADSGKSIVEMSREHNISNLTIHRWKKQFGQLEVNEAKQLNELERENTEMKKMLADSLFKTRLLEAVNAKKDEPRGTSGGWPPSRSTGACAPGGWLASACDWRAGPLTPEHARLVSVRTVRSATRRPRVSRPNHFLQCHAEGGTDLVVGPSLRPALPSATKKPNQPPPQTNNPPEADLGILSKEITAAD